MRAWARLVLVSLLAPALVVSVLPGSSPATSHCKTSGPSSGAYTVTICITAPTESTVLSGTVPVTATATTSDGRAVARVEFFLDGGYVLSDFEAPWDFDLPTDQWVDGAKLLAAQARIGTGSGAFTSSRADVNVQFANGVSTPPPRPQTFTPWTPEPGPGEPLVVAAVGDGAGGRNDAATVTDLIASWSPDMLLYLKRFA